MDYYQTITLVLTDGRRLNYSGRQQITDEDECRVLEIIVSKGKPLPPGLVFDRLEDLQENKKEPTCSK